ncbi:MAG: carbohydrate kinase family protein [Chloroflexi bacterium]|nr:carbohydrate kinase family protein [Chloroflexota bacterium]
MGIIVSGSLAYDRIMNFPGHFSDHLLPEKIHVINISFTLDGMKEKFGGTAGNIAYALTLLGENPLVLATIGHDYHKYFAWLAKNHIDCRGIKIIDEEFTASAYITTDQADNQITGFNPGAMKHPSDLDFDSVSPQDTIFIVAPGNLQDMMNYTAACRARDIDFIFDPGQSLPMWNGPDLAGCIEGSRILISNDYELDLIITRTGLNREALLERTGAIITTLGERGSQICMPDCVMDIPAARPREVVDPTGAGDAYRAGLVCGLLHAETIEQAAVMGSVCASFAVECYGTQEYTFSRQEFRERLVACQC